MRVAAVPLSGWTLYCVPRPSIMQGCMPDECRINTVAALHGCYTRLTALDLAIGTVDIDLGKSGEEPTPPFSRSAADRSEEREPFVRNAAPYVA